MLHCAASDLLTRPAAAAGLSELSACRRKTGRFRLTSESLWSASSRSRPSSRARTPPPRRVRRSQSRRDHNPPLKREQGGSRRSGFGKEPSAQNSHSSRRSLSAPQSYLDRTIALTEERGEVEAKVREALAERASADLARARLEQEKQLLEQHNTWLTDELAAKADALLAERRRSSAEEEALRNRLSEARRDHTRSARSPARAAPPLLVKQPAHSSTSLGPPQAEALSGAAKATVSRAEARVAELQAQLEDAQARHAAPHPSNRSSSRFLPRSHTRPQSSPSGRPPSPAAHARSRRRDRV